VIVRTTVTLDPDTAALIKTLMRERGLTFKEALNTTIRAGALTRNGGFDQAGFATPTFSMGATPRRDLDKALRLAGELEDEEIVREIEARR
jgi:hypothetical protein